MCFSSLLKVVGWVLLSLVPARSVESQMCSQDFRDGFLCVLFLRENGRLERGICDGGSCLQDKANQQSDNAHASKCQI